MAGHRVRTRSFARGGGPRPRSAARRVVAGARGGAGGVDRGHPLGKGGPPRSEAVECAAGAGRAPSDRLWDLTGGGGHGPDQDRGDRRVPGLHVAGADRGRPGHRCHRCVLARCGPGLRGGGQRPVRRRTDACPALPGDSSTAPAERGSCRAAAAGRRVPGEGPAAATVARGAARSAPGDGGRRRDHPGMAAGRADGDDRERHATVSRWPGCWWPERRRAGGRTCRSAGSRGRIGSRRSRGVRARARLRSAARIRAGAGRTVRVGATRPRTAAARVLSRGPRVDHADGERRPWSSSVADRGRVRSRRRWAGRRDLGAGRQSGLARRQPEEVAVGDVEAPWDDGPDKGRPGVVAVRGRPRRVVPRGGRGRGVRRQRRREGPRSTRRPARCGGAARRARKSSPPRSW